MKDKIIFHIDMNSYPMFTMMPRDSIVKEFNKIGERDVDLLQKQLAEINKHQQDMDLMQRNLHTKVVEVLSVSKEIADSSDNCSTPVDIEGLTKLIAVAQKPELINGKSK